MVSEEPSLATGKKPEPFPLELKPKIDMIHRLALETPRFQVVSSVTLEPAQTGWNETQRRSGFG